MWTLACAWVSGLLGTLIDMARVARSEVAPDMTVPADARDEGSPPGASGASFTGRRLRPPRPRDGEADTSWDGRAPSVHDDLVDAARESAALEACPVDAARESAALEASPVAPAMGEPGEVVDDVAGGAGATYESGEVAAEVLGGAVAATATDGAGEVVGGAIATVATVATERAPLTDRERAMLEFERFWWRHAGSKEQAIRDTFTLSATHYYRLLNALLDRPAAVEFDPLVVGRLRRLRASRARRRTAR